MTAVIGEPIRVVIVEDHRIVAEGINLVLSRQHDLRVVATVGTVADAIAAVEREQPDVVLIDFHLPDGSGAEVAAAARRRAPQAACVVLTADTSDEAMLACIGAGVAGYIVKSEDAANIAAALRRAARGEMLIPPSALVGLLERQRGRASDMSQGRDLVEKLTPRELEVLRLMSEGIDNRAIAGRLSITIGTARVHVQNVIEKLGTHSKLEAVVVAQRRGLIRI